jgi:putative transcriptional regulator
MIEVRLSALLEERNKSLLSLARDTGISYNTLHRLQGGITDKIAFATLEALCDSLGCSVGDILLYKADKRVKGKRQTDG